VGVKIKVEKEVAVIIKTNGRDQKVFSAHEEEAREWLKRNGFESRFKDVKKWWFRVDGVEAVIVELNALPNKI